MTDPMTEAFKDSDPMKGDPHEGSTGGGRTTAAGMVHVVTGT